jgi:hypothetical protein
MKEVSRLVDCIAVVCFEVYFLLVSQSVVLQAAFQLNLVGMLQPTVLCRSLAVVLLVEDRKAHQRHAMRCSADEQYSAKRQRFHLVSTGHKVRTLLQAAIHRKTKWGTQTLSSTIMTKMFNGTRNKVITDDLTSSGISSDLIWPYACTGRRQPR